MKTKKHSKQSRDKIIEKYQSGEGYKRISKALNISRSTVRTIIKKWKEYGTAVNVPRARCPKKIGVCARKTAVRETNTTSVRTLEGPHRWRIENLWKDWKVVRSRSSCSLRELERVSQEEWQQNALLRRAKLVQTKAVIATKGTSTKY